MWRTFSIWGAVVLVVVFVVNAVVADIDASNLWGMTYGSLATVIMVGAALLSVRRRTMSGARDRVRTWQQFHVWGGMLFVLLVLMHSEFRWPAGGLSQALLVLSLWVAASGWFGLIVQAWIPRVLTYGVDTEVVYERIPELVEELAERAENIASEGSELIQTFYGRTLRAELAGPRWRPAYFVDVSEGIGSMSRPFNFLKKAASGDEQARINALEELYRTKKELDVHFTLQRALRWWTYLHVPPSIALLVVVAVHIYVVFYY